LGLESRDFFVSKIGGSWSWHPKPVVLICISMTIDVFVGILIAVLMVLIPREAVGCQWFGLVGSRGESVFIGHVGRV